MQMPFTRSWSPLQKWLITGCSIVMLVSCAFGIYYYEHYYRGPDDSFFVGSWRGDYVPTTLYMGPPDIAFHFDADHTFDGGRWYAAGEFLYLRVRRDSGGDPYDTLEVWHIDSMSADELQMTQPGGHAILKRCRE
jgi:hypothetical protein